MSYANGTQFYNLPQTVGTDKRDWFDTNSAFAAIDAALHAAFVGQASDAEAIATINSKLADDEADIAALQTKTTTHDTQIAALQTTVNGQATQIADVRQDAEDMITANNEGAAATSTRVYAIGDYFIYNDVLYKATAAIAIGDTIVPNTNCEATNVDTELAQLNNDLTVKVDKTNNNADLTKPIYYNNTTCGLQSYSGNDAARLQTSYNSECRVFQTQDGGATWSEVGKVALYTDSQLNNLDTPLYFSGVNVALQSKEGANVARLQLNASGTLTLFSSTDGGTTWTSRTI